MECIIDKLRHESLITGGEEYNVEKYKALVIDLNEKKRRLLESITPESKRLFEEYELAADLVIERENLFNFKKGMKLAIDIMNDDF